MFLSVHRSLTAPDTPSAALGPAPRLQSPLQEANNHYGTNRDEPLETNCNDGKGWASMSRSIDPELGRMGLTACCSADGNALNGHITIFITT